ncbi:MAG TPA: endonuclease [Synergistaceae bacterium]|jgi:deoxyribonuclease-4|nr:endonuclease [Synergistaceae bacterium]
MSLIGTHVSVAGGLWKAVERGEALGCEAIQIFTKNQLQWRASPIPEPAATRFMAAWAKSSIRKVVAHGSYLLNLASVRETREKSIVALVEEIARCETLGIDDLVLHPGSHLGDGLDNGREMVAKGLMRAIERTPGTRARVLLETMSGQGHSIGSTIEDLAWILDRVGDISRIGVCLDTCHLFAGGHELRGRSSYDRLVRSVERHIGLERIGCWHLNDSRTEMGSRRDRHQHIGEGLIGAELFSCIVSDPRWEDTPCLLETPKGGPGDEGNIALLRKMRGH